MSSKHTKTNTCSKEVVVAVAVAGSSARLYVQTRKADKKVDTLCQNLSLRVLLTGKAEQNAI